MGQNPVACHAMGFGKGGKAWLERWRTDGHEAPAVTVEQLVGIQPLNAVGDGTAGERQRFEAEGVAEGIRGKGVLEHVSF